MDGSGSFLFSTIINAIIIGLLLFFAASAF